MGGTLPEDPDTLATEAHISLLVGAKSHKKYTIGYLLTDKLASMTQRQLTRKVQLNAPVTGPKLWSIVSDAASATR